MIAHFAVFYPLAYRHDNAAGLMPRDNRIAAHVLFSKINPLFHGAKRTGLDLNQNIVFPHRGHRAFSQLRFFNVRNGNRFHLYFLLRFYFNTI